MKAIRTISIKSGRPEDSDRRIKLGLFRSDGGFRWYGGNPGEAPRPVREMDSEVSGKTVAEACANARRAWAGTAWGLRGKSQNF